MVVPAKAAYTARKLGWLDRHSEQTFRLHYDCIRPERRRERSVVREPPKIGDCAI